MAFEQVGDFGVGHGQWYGFDLGVHGLGNHGGRILHHQAGERDIAQQPVILIHHIKRIGPFRQLGMQAQVAQYHLDTDIGPQGDEFGIHDGAGGVFRV